MDVTIYHNPRCSKSRATLAMLRERGIEPTVIEYLKTPPTEEQLTRILEMLGLEPPDIIRTDEEEYRRLELGKREVTPAELLVLIHEHPILLQRPIVVADGQARVGRPPEAVLDILSA